MDDDFVANGLSMVFIVPGRCIRMSCPDPWIAFHAGDMAAFSTRHGDGVPVCTFPRRNIQIRSSASRRLANAGERLKHRGDFPEPTTELHAGLAVACGR